MRFDANGRTVPNAGFCTMNKRNNFSHLRQGYGSTKAIVREQAVFLKLLWKLKSREGSYGCVSFRKAGTASFEDRFFSSADVADLEETLLDFHHSNYDQYFCPNVFRDRHRKLISAGSTYLAWCDVDEADPLAFEPTPSILWQTSPHRTQAIWIWNKSYPASRAALYSKALAYQFGGDTGGWSANKLLRLPGSVNHKRGYNAPKIKLLSLNLMPIAVRPRMLAEANPAGEAYSRSIDPFRHEPHRVLRALGSKVDPAVRMLARHKTVRMKDRSKRIFFMIAGLRAAGASPDEIASVVWSSAYFQSKYGSSRSSLEAEIIRVLSKVEGSV